MSFGNEREFIDYLQRKEGKTMKCPLLSASITTEDRRQGYQEWDCLEEECACWDKAREMCVGSSLLVEIALLTKVLSDIRDKMPHELQFRK